MQHAERARATRIRVILGSAILAGLLVGCGQAAPLQVGGLPPAPVPTPLAPTTSFQGAVASVDPEKGTIVVAVQIVWTPTIQAGGHERRVLVDARTGWDPAPVPLGELRVGQEVQVEALEAVEGVWPAVTVQLFDID